MKDLNLIYKKVKMVGYLERSPTPEK